MSQPGFSGMKSSPVADKDGRPMMKPPTIIPITTLPPHIMAQFNIPAQRFGGPMILQQPLTTQSFPPAGMPFMRHPQELSLMPGGQAVFPPPKAPTVLSAPAQLDRTSSPDDDGDDDGTHTDRHHRRREMNRIAQQKSRQKKDQKITDLEKENDKLKATIISLDAEVKVWKNMTKKSENEANDLRRRMEEANDRLEEFRRIRKNKINEIVYREEKSAVGTSAVVEEDDDETMDALKIDESVDDKVAACFEKPKEEVIEPAMTMIMENLATTDSRVDMMKKEIRSLTTELQCMYSLSNQQAESNKLLHQALEDQQSRFSLSKKKEEERLPLELCSGLQTTVVPARTTNRAGKRWLRRNMTRGISKRDIEKHKVISKITKRAAH